FDQHINTGRRSLSGRLRLFQFLVGSISTSTLTSANITLTVNYGHSFAHRRKKSSEWLGRSVGTSLKRHKIKKIISALRSLRGRAGKAEPVQSITCFCFDSMQTLAKSIATENEGFISIMKQESLFRFPAD
ncbi:MAG: hypothetical protein ACRD82_19340, partial [Blastocatellia bacterium]